MGITPGVADILLPGRADAVNDSLLEFHHVLKKGRGESEWKCEDAVTLNSFMSAFYFSITQHRLLTNQHQLNSNRAQESV
jgi:hypothetical protein